MSCPSRCATQRPAARHWRTRSVAWPSANSVRLVRSPAEPEELEMDLEAAVMGRPVLRRGGRIEWLRVARRELEAHRTRQARPSRVIAMTG